MSEDSEQPKKEGEDFVAPETGIEQEKSVRELKISPEGWVDKEGLDDIEKYLFSKASGAENYYNRPDGADFMIESIANRLGFEIQKVGDKDIKHTCDSGSTSFGWYDKRHGEPEYKKTEIPEDGVTLKFKKVESLLDDSDRDLRSRIDRYGALSDYEKSYKEKFKTDEGWMKPYWYETMKPKGMPAIDNAILDILKPWARDGGGQRGQEYFDMRMDAVVEMAKRLGYRPELGEDFEK